MWTEKWTNYESLYASCKGGKCPVCEWVDNSIEGMLCSHHYPAWALIEGTERDGHDAYLNYVNECIDKGDAMWYRALSTWLPEKRP